MSTRKTLCLLLLLAITTSALATSYFFAAAEVGPDWHEEPVRVIIQSTSDWGRMLFDDLNGTNSNGLGISRVLDSGWSIGQDFNDVLEAGRKLAWPDEVYGRIVLRHGDLVEFFKGLNDFHYTEVYADLVLNVDASLPQVYLWLMGGGNGTTTFQITSPATGGTIWRDVIVGNSVTQQVRRVMSPQPFLHPGRTESLVVIIWLGIVVASMVILNFPLLELIHRRIKHVRQARSVRGRSGQQRHSRSKEGQENH
jgi:hypothetical protein